MHLCDFQIVLKVKNQLILDFVMRHKVNACFVTPKGKNVGAYFGMGPKWAHKCEFKAKSTCTNQEKRWLVQVECTIIKEGKDKILNCNMHRQDMWQNCKDKIMKFYFH